MVYRQQHRVERALLLARRVLPLLGLPLFFLRMLAWCLVPFVYWPFEEKRKSHFAKGSSLPPLFPDPPCVWGPLSSSPPLLLSRSAREKEPTYRLPSCCRLKPSQRRYSLFPSGIHKGRREVFRLPHCSMAGHTVVKYVCFLADSHSHSYSVENVDEKGKSHGVLLPSLPLLLHFLYHRLLPRNVSTTNPSEIERREGTLVRWTPSRDPLALHG